MQIKDVMNKHVETIELKDTAMKAAVMMRNGDYGALPVMDEGNVVGMITDRDLAVRVVAEGLNAGNVLIEDIMTADVVCCQEDDTIQDAVEMMAEKQVRRLIVMNEKNKISGIVSLGDVSLYQENEAANALGGISEHRHNDPGSMQVEELTRH